MALHEAGLNAREVDKALVCKLVKGREIFFVMSDKQDISSKSLLSAMPLCLSPHPAVCDYELLISVTIASSSHKIDR